MQRFDFSHLFFEQLKNGINLFCGAGFSVEAQDRQGNKFPVGSELLTELKQAFPHSGIEKYSNLAKAATKLKNTDKSSFNTFLTERFTVHSFDEKYYELCKLNIKNVYTTNIDNLWSEIFKNTPCNKYIYDRTQGRNSHNEQQIDYFPLHGYVLHKNPKYIFTTSEVATAFSSVEKSSWEQLAFDSSKKAMLFWGWNFQDSAPIEAMFKDDIHTEQNHLKWILLHKDSKNNAEDIDFLESLGFKIIISDTAELLDYIAQYSTALTNQDVNINTLEISSHPLLEKYKVPYNIKELPKLPTSEFFTKYYPDWSHIYSSNIPKLEPYSKIIDYIAAGNNVAVIGMRCSGKTTLMKQLALFYTEQNSKVINLMTSPSIEEVESYLKILSGSKVLLFVDDCYRDTNAILKLLDAENVQLVFFDRTSSYENQIYKFKNKNIKSCDITEISQKDAQNILNCIPQALLFG